MANVHHTGIVVSAAEADAWQAEIREIMAERKLNFGPAVDVYIKERRKPQLKLFSKFE
jgi:hypothetical protein